MPNLGLGRDININKMSKGTKVNVAYYLPKKQDGH